MLIPAMTVKTETGDCVVVPTGAGVPDTGCCALAVDETVGGTVVWSSVEGVLFMADASVPEAVPVTDTTDVAVPAVVLVADMPEVVVLGVVVVIDAPGVTVTEGLAVEFVVTETPEVVEVCMDMKFAETGVTKTARIRSRITGSTSFKDNL